MGSIRIGTRGSKLALWQAEWVAGEMRRYGHEVELCVVATRGDVSTQSLSQVGGQGLFTKEIQRELLDSRVDVAVHSLKDLPTLAIEGLCIAAVPTRELTDDCLISRTGVGFMQLPAGSRIGTGSSRRGAQLLAWRQDVEIADIRGNVDSRLKKLADGQYDAIVLAAAGLTRLQLTDSITEWLPMEKMLPAVGQGALGLECRTSDARVKEALAMLSDSHTMSAVTAERALLRELLAGCLAPVAALGQVQDDGTLQLRARVLSVDGRHVIEGHQIGAIEDADALGAELAELLRSQGAADLIESARRVAASGK